MFVTKEDLIGYVARTVLCSQCGKVNRELCLITTIDEEGKCSSCWEVTKEKMIQTFNSMELALNEFNRD